MTKKYHKDVHFVCKIAGIKAIEKKYGKLKNYDVVLTNERKEHIIKQRNKESAYIFNYLKETIRKFDFILEAKDGAVLFIKRVDSNNCALIVKLSLNSCVQGNSILTGYAISKKNIK